MVTKIPFPSLCKTVRKGGSFPDLEHTYGMPPSEISKLKQYLESKINTRNLDLPFRKIILSSQNKLKGSDGSKRLFCR